MASRPTILEDGHSITLSISGSGGGNNYNNNSSSGSSNSGKTVAELYQESQRDQKSIVCLSGQKLKHRLRKLPRDIDLSKTVELGKVREL